MESDFTKKPLKWGSELKSIIGQEIVDNNEEVSKTEIPIDNVKNLSSKDNSWDNVVLLKKSSEKPNVQTKKYLWQDFNTIANVVGNENNITNTQEDNIWVDEEIINIDVDYIIKQIQDVIKSPSPLTLYKKSTELKDNFGKFINYLAKKIENGFSSQNKTIILNMYQSAKYERVWFDNLKNYLEETKYFDVRMYLKVITTFDKEKQYISKSLLKIFLKTNKVEVEKFLKKYWAKVSYIKVQEIFNNLNLSKIKILEKRFLNENKIECFLEKIYLDENTDLGLFFEIFSFNIDEIRWKFKDTYQIFSEITQSYLRETSPKTKFVYEYLYSDENIDILNSIDELIVNYSNNKKTFYKSAKILLEGKNSIERWYFWWYIKTKMIDKYFNNVKRLFYWDRQVCVNRNDWANLKWSFIYNPKGEHKSEIKEIMEFKKLILELNSNIFAPFLKPLIYSIVSEKLSVNNKDLLKIKYLMTLVLSENFQEYRIIYNFFEDLEVFMDWNMWPIGFNYAKIKIFAVDILIWFGILVWTFIYAPVGIFVWLLMLSVSYLRTHFVRFKSWIEWNLGIKPLAIVLLVISWFYWITNLDSTKVDLAKLNSKIEKLWIYKTDEATVIAIKKFNSSWIKEAIANILQSK